MTASSKKNHRLVDMLEIHVDTDGLEHEISYDRLREILDGYDILLGTLADSRTYNAGDIRVQQQETAGMKLSHKLYLSPAKEGCYSATALLYDDSDDQTQELPLYGVGFERVLQVIDCTANGDAEQFGQMVPSKLARKRVLEGVRKVSPAENERMKVVSGIEKRKTTDLKQARLFRSKSCNPWKRITPTRKSLAGSSWLTSRSIGYRFAPMDQRSASPLTMTPTWKTDLWPLAIS